MRKKFTANFVGIAYLVTIRKNFRGKILNEKMVYHFNGWVDHPQFNKIARNIVSAQVKKDMSIFSHLRGYAIESIEEL